MNATSAVKYEQEIPEVIKALVGVHQTMVGEGFDRTVTHLVHLRASQINGCAHCLKMHLKEARHDGETDERLDRLVVWRHVNDFSEREKAALAWTEALTSLEKPSDLGALRAELRQHFSEKEIGLLTCRSGPDQPLEPASGVETTDMPARDDSRIFEEASPRLLGLAYRILGSRADAEDAVQDTFIKWQGADRRAIENPVAWLTTACTRRCIDLLRSAHRTRVDYVGTWLPEPIHMPVEDNADNTLALTSSLSTAFLLMLERLTPKERAAYLLHEIFEMSYADVAEHSATIRGSGLPQADLAGARQHRSGQGAARQRRSSGRRNCSPLLKLRVVEADGDGSPETALPVRRQSGWWPTVAARRPRRSAGVLQGKAEILQFVGMAQKWWATFRWVETDLNGGRGVVLFSEGEPCLSAMSFAYDERWTGATRHLRHAQTRTSSRELRAGLSRMAELSAYTLNFAIMSSSGSAPRPGVSGTSTAPFMSGTVFA